MHDAAEAKIRIRVWDAPVRLFHWLLASAFLIAWLTRHDALLHIHVFAGYAFAGLLGFRLVWGLVGSRYALFQSFAYGWRDAAGYLKDLLARRPPRYLGHNPAGSWAVYILLALLLLVAITGFVTLGGEERHGPLAGFLSFAAGERAHALHELLAWTALGMIAVHVLGVVVESLIHRENLVAAMISGHKRALIPSISARPHRLLASAVAVIIAVSGVVYFRDGLRTANMPYLPFSGPALADNGLWRQECGGCHLAYHPSLLPARSWEALMRQQHTHFGEDLALEPEAANAIARFLVNNSAEHGASEAAWRINNGTPATEMPLRVTETSYWRRKHDSLPPETWRSRTVSGKHDCAACHLDAQQGWFEDGAIRLPAGR